MAMNGTAPATGRILISDDYLEANRNNRSAAIDLINQTPSQAFVHNDTPPSEMLSFGRNGPRGVSMNHDRGDTESYYAWINYRAPNDPHAIRERFACAVTHPQQVAVIYPYNTTARGILIKT